MTRDEEKIILFGVRGWMRLDPAEWDAETRAEVERARRAYGTVGWCGARHPDDRRTFCTREHGHTDEHVATTLPMPSTGRKPSIDARWPR